MGTLFLVFLFVHLGAAIVAFGPTFAFPIIGAMGGREPMHVNFALRAADAVAHRLVLPLAIVVGVSGLGLVWTSGRNIFREGWLLVAIVLYLVALGYSLAVSSPTVAKLIAATSALPPGAGGPGSGGPAAGGPGGPPAGGPAAGGPPAGAPAAGGPPAGAPAAGGPPAGGPAAGAPAGPPPHIAALVKKAQRNGMVQTALLVAIFTLMIFKPFGG